MTAAAEAARRKLGKVTRYPTAARCQRNSSNLYYPNVTTRPAAGARTLVVSEILWDVSADAVGAATRSPPSAAPFRRDEESGAADHLRRSPVRRRVPRPARLLDGPLARRVRRRARAAVLPSDRRRRRRLRSDRPHRRSIRGSAPGTTSRALAARTDVMADVIVNHVSRHSPQFLDFDARGDASPYAGMFLTFARVFPDGASEPDLLALHAPRPGCRSRSTRRRAANACCSGRRSRASRSTSTCTIPKAGGISTRFSRASHDAGIRAIRLDAVGYAVKKAGTSCFMIPETFAFIAGPHRAGARARHGGAGRSARALSRSGRDRAPGRLGLRLRAAAARAAHAVHARRDAACGDGSTSGRATPSPCSTRTTASACWTSAPDRRRTRPACSTPARDRRARRGRSTSAAAARAAMASGSAASNVDADQINCTFYDALGGSDDEYLVARAIQCFLPGIPQVYYVGLLAGRNDMTLLAPHRRRPRHQPPLLHGGRSAAAARPAHRRADAGAPATAQHASGVRRRLRREPLDA